MIIDYPNRMSPKPSRRIPQRLAETLLIASLGGTTLGLAGFPAGWLSGAIVAVVIAALLGRPVMVPMTLTRCVFVVLGISLGTAMTPATLARVASWPASLTVLMAAMTCATV